MGIYDRDYYRDRVPARTLRVSSVVPWLVGINVLVWILQLLVDGVTGSLSNRPASVIESHQYWRLLTAGFCHDPRMLWHILFNMLVLWWFGKEIERIYGPVDFLLFYLVAGLFANAVYAYSAYYILAPHEVGRFPGIRHVDAIGASGSVMGVLILFALFFPRRTVYVFGMLPLPVWALAVIYVVADLTGFLGGSRGGVANAAHLGGAIFAVLYRFVDLRVGRFLRRPQRRAARRREEPVRRGPPRVEEMEAMRARVDEILIKINRSGLESLTAEERTFLQEMSRYFGKERRRGGR